MSETADQVRVSLEGTQLDTVSTAAGKIIRLTHTVEVSDGQLTLRLHDLGGSTANAAIAGLDIETLVTETQYSYAPLGRLDTVEARVRDGVQLASPEATDYLYDLLGNLDEVGQLSNGVVSDYTYDGLNRLTLLCQFKDGAESQQSNVYESGVDTLFAEYDYDLAANGKRTGVTEKILVDSVLEQTRIDWLYDNIGRLAREFYNSDDDSLDFVADYTFLVGNRLTKQTDTDPTFSGDPTFDETVTCTYDANDRLLNEAKDDRTAASEDRFTQYAYTQYAYDATQQIKKTVWQNLTGSGDPLEITDYAYNLQGRMATVKVDSDADGNTNTQFEYEYNDHGIRVAETKKVDANDDGEFADAGDSTDRTEYVVDERNATGYAQVFEEWLNGELAKSYTLGLDVISQWAAAIAVGKTLLLLYDGHGSTRGLVDATGQPLSGQVFRYDAYGNRLDSSAAATSLLYSGEKTDPTGLQYLRARYYNPATGTFNRLDPFSGRLNDPQSLHKYLYVHADPLNAIDPSGEMSLASHLSSMRIGLAVSGMSAGATMYVGHKAGKTIRGFYAGSTLFLSMVHMWSNWPLMLQASKEGAWGGAIAALITAAAELPGAGGLSESARAKLKWEIGFTFLEGFVYPFAAVALNHKARITGGVAADVTDFLLGQVQALSNLMENVAKGRETDGAMDWVLDGILSVGTFALAGWQPNALTKFIRDKYGMNPTLVRELLERVPKLAYLTWNSAAGQQVRDFCKDLIKECLVP